MWVSYEVIKQEVMQLIGGDKVGHETSWNKLDVRSG
jgi:hypothetical protein